MDEDTLHLVIMACRCHELLAAYISSKELKLLKHGASMPDILDAKTNRDFQFFYETHMLHGVVFAGIAHLEAPHFRCEKN